ncbi:hypothetical protein H5410_041193 [Solanum commersonii]|uniref:CCHC-type domain-containing protein n=1 Tax=Solanum commersonii TaxID=4109 RepID=A0A9J5XSZ2_SOLCO|nr:hypothetical protein H5410_041193 [Solanum commersonii]
MEEKASIINAVATDEGIDNLGMALVKNREDVVYTLVLTILEHFNSRFTNQHETVCTLLNGLRCQTLGVMELPENKIEYWKAKFIHDLPPLFAERVRKTLRGTNIEIPYKDLTYGKIIGTCTQEGLNFCNELKMDQQLKMGNLRERSQLGDFCAQLGLPDPTTKSSNKHKYHKSKEDRKARKSSRKSNRFTKDRSGRDLSKEKCYKCGHFGHIASNCKLNKLKILSLIEKPMRRCMFTGNDCNCEDDEIYKLQSQFQDFNMNTITSDNLIELLKEITDRKLREKIIDLATSNEASSSSSKPFESKKNDSNDFEYLAPYSLKEVDDRLLKRHTFSEKYSSFNDLKTEVENLKKEFKFLKQNQLICDHRITQIETHNSENRFFKNKGIAENHVEKKTVNPDPKQDTFLGMMQIVTAHKWYVKCINSKGFSATYKDNEITYSFVIDPVTRDINALINMKQNHMDSLQMELFSMNIFDSLKSSKIAVDICADHPRSYICRMDPPWIHIKERGRGRSVPGRESSYGAMASSTQGSSYRSSSNSPVIQLGKRTLINKKISSQEESSSSSKKMVNLEESPLYAHMQANLEG